MPEKPHQLTEPEDVTARRDLNFGAGGGGRGDVHWNDGWREGGNGSVHRGANAYIGDTLAEIKQRRDHVNLNKLEADLSRNPLHEIAMIMQSLTYGEMMELGQSIWKANAVLAETIKKINSATPLSADAITADALPMVLHTWSKARQGGPAITPSGEDNAPVST